MTIPAVVPVQSEADFLVQAITKEACQGENAQIGRLPVTHLPGLGLTLACGGLGKVQFGVQTQYLLDMCSDWDLVLCAGAVGALVDWLAVGDVLVATETVEHDIRNQFGEPGLAGLGPADSAGSPLSRFAESPTEPTAMQPLTLRRT
jgi:nucleoside phosphorylase